MAGRGMTRQAWQARLGEARHCKEHMAGRAWLGTARLDKAGEG